jgi:hypothetical protein
MAAFRITFGAAAAARQPHLSLPEHAAQCNGFPDTSRCSSATQAAWRRSHIRDAITNLMLEALAA